MSIRSRVKATLQSAIVPTLVRSGWRGPSGTSVSDLRPGRLFGYDDEEAIRAAALVVSPNTMSSFERLATLWQQVKYLDRYRIAGALVECGVWKGGSSGMMALAHQASTPQPSRELHLFDSFEGLPEPRSDKDGDYAIEYSGNHATGVLKPIDQCVGTLDENREFLEKKVCYPHELLKYHVGWFEETVPRTAPSIDKIALLRLDGDWYESTKICLDHLFPRVANGGIIVIDDYGHWEGCRKAVDEFLADSPEPVLLNHIDYTGRYWIRLKS